MSMEDAALAANQEQETAEEAGELETRTGEEGGESEAKAKESGSEEEGGETESGELSPEQLKASYKELQRKFGKTSEEFKSVKSAVDKMGGIEQLSRWFDYLSTNPRFAEFIEQEKSRNSFGINMDELDDEGKKALDLVKKVAESIADEKIKAITGRIDPIAESITQAKLNDYFSQMSQKHKGWEQYKETMLELIDELPTSRQNNPTYKDIETLYLRALVESGDFEKVAAQQLQEKIAAKKKLSTDKPAPSAAKGSYPQAKSIMEAWKQAKEQGA